VAPPEIRKEIMRILKILNPFVFLWNAFKYTAHLETYRDSKKYVPYDFSQETAYFK